MDFGLINSEQLKHLSVEELNSYSAYLRERIIDVTKKNGGHLSSNLGAVELTVALHYVFDMPKDKVIWDVGHQTYAHKFITNRGELMSSLRTDGGASGFPSSKESEFDTFITGHSGTSLSMALGLSRARDINGSDEKVVAVVGDGAFTSGEIYEALNDLGDRPTPLIIVLNDNKMSISRNVGAMSKYFNKLRVNKNFVDLKSDFKTDLNGLPFVGKPLVRALTGVKNKVKGSVIGNKFFERFGLKYYGPYDGHNISDMINALSLAATSSKPVIIHFLTQKGKGLVDAELHPDAYHGISPIGETKQKSMSAVAGQTLIELAEKENIAVVTAAMSDGLCFNNFAEKFPDRFFDVAIAEQHAVSFCAGLAKSGVKPFFGVYSTFLQRGFDQVLHDVCLNNLPVTFLIDRAGAVGADGVTHQGIFDLSYLSLIPNLVIASPKDGRELKALMEFSLGVNRPMAIRYAKSYEADFEVQDNIELGKWEVLINSNSPITILAVGRTNEIAAKIKNATIVNARFIKPLDTQYLDTLSGTVITLEDNILHGGFGQAVKDYLYGKCKVINIGHKNEFCDIRSIQKTYFSSGLTVDNIQKIVDSELSSLEKHAKL
ncbi:MAG: 1-deoxy-D-xylulose-5-phosphate synthase [Clostridiales bacterium]|nr:1-deoxy-D-xylulose-5-phosphate synthase [Clostridiales bacterium]